MRAFPLRTLKRLHRNASRLTSFEAVKVLSHPESRLRKAGPGLTLEVDVRLGIGSYIIHLNIALSMVVSVCFGGKSHVSNWQNVSFKEPCYMLLASYQSQQPSLRLQGGTVGALVSSCNTVAAFFTSALTYRSPVAEVRTRANTRRCPADCHNTSESVPANEMCVKSQKLGGGGGGG